MSPDVVAAWSGSAVSERVLEIAAGFAQRRDAPLRAVLGWDFLDQPGTTFDPALTPEKVAARLESALAPIRVRYPDLDVVGEARMGWAPAIIAEVAERAEVLVVGRSARTMGHFGDWCPDVLCHRVKVPVVYVP